MYYLCRDQNRHIYYMNMRSLKYFSFGVIGMVLASCVEEKNLYNPDEGTPEDTQLGLSTDFLLKTQRSVFITAVDGDGKSQAGVKFGVFMSQPYTGEGVISIDPVFVGYTDASGKLKAEVVIGNNVSKIYVAPLTAGYGQVKEADVQDFVSLEFQGVSFPHMAVSRAFSIEIPSFSGPISGLYQLYIPYKNVEISRDGIPLQGGCSLVSKEQLSPALINQIDSWYPERQNVQKADLDKNSDLRVVDENGARVWVTYVGDGGFYVANQTVYNSLMYYNYKEEELNSPNDIDHLRKFFRLMLKVIIHRYDELPFCMGKSAQKCRMLAEISCHLDDLHTGILLPEFFHYFKRTVFRSVIYQDQFKFFFYCFPENFFQASVQFLQRMF